MAAYISFNPEDHFNTVLYTGDGGTQAITGVGFTPDYVCIKSRSTGWQFVNWNTMTGAGDDEELSWNATNPRGGPDAYSYGQISVLGADGFTVAPGGGGGVQFVNVTSGLYASWNWKMGTTTGIAGSPSITPTEYTFNSTAKQSLIRYTGTGAVATLPHGLGVAPTYIWIKKESSGATDWQMGNGAVGWTKYATSNTTAAFSTNSGAWNDTAPTSTLFTIGANGECNTSSSTYIAFCAADVPGYSKAGTYQGNGDADGSYVFTGFRPAWLLLHSIPDAGYNWPLYDNKREGFNGGGSATTGNNWFLEDTSDAEDTTSYVDLLSNGFKFRSSNGHLNGARPYSYMAFAEQPIVSSNDIAGMAR